MVDDGRRIVEECAYGHLLTTNSAQPPCQRPSRALLPQTLHEAVPAGRRCLWRRRMKCMNRSRIVSHRLASSRTVASSRRLPLLLESWSFVSPPLEPRAQSNPGQHPHRRTAHCPLDSRRPSNLTLPSHLTLLCPCTSTSAYVISVA
jgi:hypothetical protein